MTNTLIEQSFRLDCNSDSAVMHQSVSISVLHQYLYLCFPKLAIQLEVDS